MKKLLYTFLAISVIFSACEKEEEEPTNNNNSGNNTNLAIGDTHQGGIIFYLDNSGRGLVAAPSDQSNGAPWGCQGTSIPGAEAQAIGTGLQNTIDIEAGCTILYTAADICANLSLGGYNDWFLPSRDEFECMYWNIGLGDSLGLGNVGSFVESSYWTSSEWDAYSALHWLPNGTATDGAKYGPKNVRAVRSF